MSEWASPQGILAICMVVTTVILPMIVHVLNLAGKKELAEKASELQRQAEAAERGLTSVIQGVQDFKSLAHPEQAKALVETLRRRNQTTGAEVIVGPIVQAIQEGEAAPAAVRRETTRLTRRVS